MRKSTTCMLFFCGFIGSALGQDKTLYEEVTFNDFNNPKNVAVG